MTRRMFTTLPVWIDSRERPGHVWLFPRNLHFMYRGKMHTVRVVTGIHRLPEGDYVDGCVRYAVGFERKASLRELYGNLLGKDQSRARYAFSRFSESFLRPIVVVTVPPTAFAQKKYDPVFGLEVDGSLVFDALTRLVTDLKMDLWVTGSCKTVLQRRAMGILVARTFLQNRLEREGYYEDASI